MNSIESLLITLHYLAIWTEKSLLHQLKLLSYFATIPFSGLINWALNLPQVFSHLQVYN